MELIKYSSSLKLSGFGFRLEPRAAETKRKSQKIIIFCLPRLVAFSIKMLKAYNVKENPEIFYQF